MLARGMGMYAMRGMLAEMRGRRCGVWFCGLSRAGPELLADQFREIENSLEFGVVFIHTTEHHHTTSTSKGAETGCS